MNRLRIPLLLSFIFRVGFAQEEDPGLQHLFVGTQTVELRLRNDYSGEEVREMTLRLLQLTSATAAPVHEVKWKSVRLLRGQTVLETVELQLPEVKEPTEFAVQAVDTQRRVLGLSHLRVYPRDYLRRLETMTGKGGLGVSDPGKLVTLAFNDAQLPFVDLEAAENRSFRGKLAIVVSTEEKSTETERVKALSNHGVAILWCRKVQTADPGILALPLKNSGQVLTIDFTETTFMKRAEVQAALVRIAERLLLNDEIEQPKK